MTSNQDEIERRVELAGRVQVLDERTHHITKAVDRIEKNLEKYSEQEEHTRHEIYRIKGEIAEMIGTFKDSIEEKLDATIEKVEETVNPINDEFKKVKTIYKVIAALGTVILLTINFVSDSIKDDYNKTKQKVETVEKRQNEVDGDIVRLGTQIRNLNEKKEQDRR